MATVKVQFKGQGSVKTDIKTIYVPEGIDPVEVGFHLASLLKRKNPFDTGRSRRGWTLRSYESGNVVVFNKVHYVQYLENGHSDQARNGFIAISINETIRWMRGLSPEEASTISLTGKATDRLLESATIRAVEQRTNTTKPSTSLSIDAVTSVSDETVAKLINTLIEEGRRRNTLPSILRRKILKLLESLGVIRG